MKQRYLHFIVVLFLTSIFTIWISGQEATKEPVESENGYQKDFLMIVGKIKEEYLGFAKEPLQTISHEDFEILTRSVYDELKSTKSRLDFYYTISKFIACLNDGHAGLGDVEDTSMPLSVFWFEDGLYVTYVYDNDYQSLLYKKILKINRIPIREFEEMVNAYIPADKGNLYAKRAQNYQYMMNRGLLNYLGLLNDKKEAVIEYDDNGTFKSKEVRTDFKKEDSHLKYYYGRNDITRWTINNSYQILDEYKTVYVQLNKLPERVDEKYYDEIFKKAKEQEMKHLVLDLRNNSGGNSLWCDVFLKYIVRKAKNIYMYNGWQRVSRSRNQKHDGKDRVYPVSKDLRFEGDVYVLTGPDTFSSATFFVVAIKDNELGKIIGLPCGNNSTRFGYVSRILLPKTALTFKTTIRIWERAYPGILEKEPLYIEPNVYTPIRFKDFLDKRDPAWDYLVRNIFTTTN